MRFGNTWPYLLAACLILCLTGCMSAKTIPLGNPQPRPALAPDSVRVFSAERDVPFAYDEVAVIEVKADPAYVNQTRMIEEARKRAGAVGADAIILGEFKDRSLAASLLIGGERKVQILAVRLREDEPKVTVAQPDADRTAAPVLAGTGSAFFVSSSGHLMSNSHVIRACREVRANGEVLEVLRSDEGNDLALLRSSRTPPAVATFRDGRSLRAGESVVAVGFPLTGVLASEPNVTVGNVSALAGLRDDLRFLQITAPVQPGNSGGPLLDDHGRVVGVVTSKLNAVAMLRITGDIAQNVNFAINASFARLMLDNVGVPYESSAVGGSMNVADIADRAKRYTVLLECWR